MTSHVDESEILIQETFVRISFEHADQLIFNVSFKVIFNDR